jgi:hypothetical protein
MCPAERMLGQISVRSWAIPDRLRVPTPLTVHPHRAKGVVVGALRSKKRLSGGLQKRSAPAVRRHFSNQPPVEPNATHVGRVGLWSRRSSTRCRGLRARRPNLTRLYPATPDAMTFRFSGGSPPEQVPFALVSVLRAGPFGPSGAAGLKFWPDFGRMDPSPGRPLGYELRTGSFLVSMSPQTRRSTVVGCLADSTVSH